MFAIFAVLIVFYYTIPFLAYVNNDNISVKSSNTWKLDGPRIYIDDSDPNYDWGITAQRKAWCTGTGSKYDPYIIQNIEIDGTGNSLFFL